MMKQANKWVAAAALVMVLITEGVALYRYGNREDAVILKGEVANRFLMDSRDPQKQAEAFAAVRAADKRRYEIAVATKGSSTMSMSLAFCGSPEKDAGKGD